MSIVENFQEWTYRREDIPIPRLSINKLSLEDQIKKMTTVLYKKRNNGLILDPKEFDKMLVAADLDLKGFLTEIYNILIPNNRSAYNRNEDKKQVVAILYLMAGLRNKHANNFKLELALYLAGSGTTCDTINALSNAGVLVTYQTVYNYKKKIASEYPIRITKYFNDNKNNLCIYNIDDYHNIHSKQHPDSTSLSSAIHFATSVCKKVDESSPVPIIFNERREERKMNNAILIGIQEQKLHSLPDYLNALNMILDYNKQINHLTGNVAPIVADWPGQLYICKALTYLNNGNKNLLKVQPEIISFIPLLGPLHVSLNTREHIIKIYYPFFEKLFHSIFREQLLDNLIPAALDIYALLFQSGSFNDYVETIFRIWTFALRWKRKNYNKAPLAFLSDIFYWEKNNHPMREKIEKHLVQFNDYWIENMHSRIRATTSPKDSANNIKLQAYILDYQKYSAFREMFSTTKRYPYSPQELKFLTNKTCLFLLSQFQKIYKNNNEANLISVTSMPAGFSTPFPPSFNNCDSCRKSLIINNSEYNVNAFLKTLNSEKHEEDLNEDDDQDDDDDDQDDTNNSEDRSSNRLNMEEDMELDLQNRIDEMNEW
ncbi:hypothetical protein C2G38_2211592 [Gigaspora rosea]|uniref:Uncharacterized protein n=1 Tax=Gigaspora rosea TaxID=44941 RepID=A0A397UFT6_9GLOM|nr:hypothetical protein C2G38_2211592 [Gigaspora rosea]